MAFVPMDDRDGWIWINGDFVPWREAKTHVLTHALHYGSSVFEGERHWFRNHTSETFAFLELFAPVNYKTVWDDPDLK